MRIVSLFSGAGGLDLGLIQAGHQVVWANDIDADAVATYRKNIGHHICCCDIKEIEVVNIPNADVVVGGFPCQGFSVANLRRDIGDERNELYKFFYKVVEAKQPNYFIAENVKGILSIGKGAAIRQITEDFSNAGYRVEVHKVNMADYGIPQHRERVFIVGQRVGIRPVEAFPFPQKTHSKDGVGMEPWVSIRSAIEGLPSVHDANGDPNNRYSKYKVVYRNFTAHRPTNPDSPSPTILARGNGKGGVCTIPHYNGTRRLSVRESAVVQTFPTDYVFIGSLGSCYRQIGNAVPVAFGRLLGLKLKELER